MRTTIQKLGKSLMAPLSIIVAAGLLLGLASTLQNELIFGNALANIGIIQGFVGLVNALVGGMFGLLPMLFCISVAIGMSREDKEIAAFSSVIGFMLFHIAIRFFLSLKGITAETVDVEYLIQTGLSQVEAIKINTVYEELHGIFTYRMSIFGGIITGLWVSVVHNRFHQTQLPIAFSFFSGKRFVPIMTTVTIPVLSGIMFFAWPVFSTGINALGDVIQGTGVIGTFIYGFLERLLIPTGLHHILNQLVRFTPIGGMAVIDGEQISGALNIFNMLLMQPNPDLGVMKEATRFLTQGTHPFMVFGLPAACYAMYKTALPENKNKVKGILFAAGITSFLTGITEPIEFAFIFISPILYIFHALMAGLSFLINSLLGVMIGNAGGGLIDLMIFGVLRGGETKWYLNVIVGFIYAVIYYNVFKFVIIRFNIKTPGRDSSDTYDETDDTLIEAGAFGTAIMEALGGRNNIREIDNCISRLRLVVNDTNLADDKKLKAAGALGIIRINETNMQVIYGAKVEKAALELKKAYRAKPESIPVLTPVSGTRIPAADVNDPVFSAETLGTCAAVIPETGVVTAPLDGEVVMITDSLHAVGIKSPKGVEVLIHIGIDTINLKGRHFTGYVKKGGHVAAGDTLIKFDKEALEQDGYDPVTLTIISNTADFKNIAITDKKQIKNKDVLMNVYAH